MPLETGSVIADLDSSWPLGTDNILQGDDHLRLIKAVLKAQFPGAADEGFAVPIVATEEEINYLEGASDNIQDQINTIIAGQTSEFPAGTRMIFAQSSPPTGWTKSVSETNRMLHLTDGAGGTIGGSDSPINWNSAHTHGTSNFSLLPEHIPNLNIQLAFDESSQSDEHALTTRVARGRSGAVTNDSSPITIPGALGNAHNHGNTSSSGATFTPKYVNVIIGIKDA